MSRSQEAGVTTTAPASFMGQAVFLLLSGPSLKAAPLDRLAGRQVVTVNRTIEHFPVSTASIVRDSRVYEYLEQRGCIGSYRGLLVRLIGPDRDTNAGLGALKWILGGQPKAVYIAGLDLNTDGMQDWYHDGYPWSPHQGELYKGYIESFEAMPEEERRIVKNLNPRSAVRGFEFVTWEEAIEGTE